MGLMMRVTKMMKVLHSFMVSAVHRLKSDKLVNHVAKLVNVLKDVVKALSVLQNREIGPTFFCIALLIAVVNHLVLLDHALQFCDEFVVESEAYEFVNSKPICV